MDIRESIGNFGIGVDIEDIRRFRKLNPDSDKGFLNRVFTKNELEYCFSKEDAAPHLTARYTGKEAVIKALSGICKPKLDYKDIEIFNNTNGVPMVKLKNKDFNKFGIKISLSHCKDKAVAFAIVIGV